MKQSETMLPQAAGADAAARPVLIASEIYRSSSYGSKHPLGIARVSAALDLCHAAGWIAPDQYVDSPGRRRSNWPGSITPIISQR